MYFNQEETETSALLPNYYQKKEDCVIIILRLLKNKYKKLGMYLGLTTIFIVLILLVQDSRGIRNYFLNKWRPMSPPKFGYSSHGKSYYYVERLVWHNGQTIGVLGFRGKRRQMTQCRLIIIESTDENKKFQVLDKLAQNFPIEEVNFQTMLNVVQACEDLQPTRGDDYDKNTSSSHSGSVSLWTMLRGIAPGTKWCGVNDIAKNYYDLGENFHLDKCCRAHDHCPIKIKAFNSNYGAVNYHPYTKSHCACDDLFYQCLKKIKTNKEQVQSIGNIFFNVLNLQCIEPRYPTYCAETVDNVTGTLIRHDPPSLLSNRQRRRTGKAYFNLFDIKTPDVKSNNKTKSTCKRWQADNYGIPKFVPVLPRKRF